LGKKSTRTNIVCEYMKTKKKKGQMKETTDSDGRRSAHKEGEILGEGV